MKFLLIASIPGMRRKLHDDRLAARPCEHDWISLLFTDIEVGVYKHTSSCSLSSDKTAIASKHPLSFVNKVSLSFSERYAYLVWRNTHTLYIRFSVI